MAKSETRTASGRYTDKKPATKKGMPPAGKKAATITLHHDGKGGISGHMSKARGK